MSLTIVEPSPDANTESGSAGATLRGLGSFNKDTKQSVTESGIRYVDRGDTTFAESEIPPVNESTYTAMITLVNVKTEDGEGSSVTASVDYEIKKTDLVTTDKENSVPAVVIANNIIHNGMEEQLVTVIYDAIGGTMYYAQGENSTTTPADEIYSTSIPTGMEVGTYYVWCKVLGDENHNDKEPECIKVMIVPDGKVEEFKELLKTLPEKEGVTLSDKNLVAAEESDLIIVDEEASVEEVVYTEEAAFEETESEECTAEFIEEESASESSSNAVEAAQGLVYTGEAQELINVSEADGNDYSLDGKSFSGEIPTGTNAGEYVVYIKNTAGDK